MSSDLQVSTQTGTNMNDYLSVGGQDLKTVVEASLVWLKTNQQIVNSLNVFPVPDGDTGTNMVLTMQAAYNEIANSDETNVGKMAHAIAKGALLGARGNSGVILSQLWRGFARVLDNHEKMDAKMFILALAEARVTAYKGVVRPVEGTILTVASDISIAAEQAFAETRNIKDILEKIVEGADESVKRTPDLLPILKQAGVVDSGGKGLFYIFEGVWRFLTDQPLGTPLTAILPISGIRMHEAMEAVEPGQDYEVVIDFQPVHSFNLEMYYEGLTEIGTSVQVGEGDGMYRMHIHVPTDHLYAPIDFTRKLGTITNAHIENLMVQMDQSDQAGQFRQDIKLAEVKAGQIAVVVVSPGDGISRIFASLGAAAIVKGGQTMNPSTEEIFKAVENLPTDKVVILPNNKNIILAAQAVIGVSKKKVAVIPSKSIPQGLSAIFRLSPDGNFEQVTQSMTEALDDIDTGEITIATRSVEINNVKVKSGEVIALYNGTLIDSTASLEEACFKLLEKAETGAKERITFFHGSNITTDEVNMIVEKVSKRYPSHEIEVHEGGQPHYQFIIAIE